MKIYIAMVNKHTGESVRLTNFWGHPVNFDSVEDANEQIALLKKTGGWMGQYAKEPENFSYMIQQLTDEQEHLVEQYGQGGYVIDAFFPGEYILLVHPSTLWRVRLYDNGQVWEMVEGAEYVRVK